MSAQTASALTCGVLKAESSRDRLDLPLDDFRTLGEDHGNRCPAQRSALRMHRRRHPGRGVHLDGGTFVLRRLFRRRHQYRLWPPADRPSRQSLRPSHPGQGTHCRAVPGRIRLSLSSQHAGRSHSTGRSGGLHLLERDAAADDAQNEGNPWTRPSTPPPNACVTGHRCKSGHCCPADRAGDACFGRAVQQRNADTVGSLPPNAASASAK